MQKIIGWSWGVSLSCIVVAGAAGCLGGGGAHVDAPEVEPSPVAASRKSDASHRLPSTPTEYHVLTVNPSQGSVMINAGRDQGVRRGMTFLVLREGRIFNTILIEDVFPDMARGVYRNPDQPPQEDDALYSEEFRAIRQAFLHRIENPVDQLRGTVVETRPELGLVYLDIGERDGVEPEMWFTVTKNGRFVGNVQIREVYDHLSFAVATEGGMGIEPGGVARSLERVARRDVPLQDEVASPDAPVLAADPDQATSALTAEREDIRESSTLAEVPPAVPTVADVNVSTPRSVTAGSMEDLFSILAAETTPERIGSTPSGGGVSADARARGRVDVGAGMGTPGDLPAPDVFSVFHDFERRRAAQSLAESDGDASAMMPAGDDHPSRSDVWIEPAKLQRLLDVPALDFDAHPGLDDAVDGAAGKEGAARDTSSVLPDQTETVRRELTERVDRLLGLEPEKVDPGSGTRPVAPPVHLTQPDSE